MNQKRKLGRTEQPVVPGKRTVAMYETGRDGIERVIIATSAPEVVAVVEHAISDLIARKFDSVLSNDSQGGRLVKND